MEYANPYVEIEKIQKLRTTFELSKRDASRLRSYESREGVLQTTLAILLTKLLNELERAKVQVGDWSTFQRAVADCNIVFGGATVKPATRRVNPKSGKAANRND